MPNLQVSEPLVQGPQSAVVDPEANSVHPVLLAWRNVCYTVKEKKRGVGQVDKRILQNISGHAAPGSLTAIIGASGSGKTSLLSVLASRLLASKGATLTGELTLNGEPVPQDYRTRCAYVQQTEVFYPYNTVRETVEMASRMRLGRRMSKQDKKDRAVAMIQQLGLSKCMDTKVGDGNRVKGISGGEMKRVAIACELVSSPSLMLLDEPTSGLDSNAALNVVKGLKDLSLTGRTIVASVHQPGSAIYSLFDNLLVLAEGQVAYFGPGNATIDYFSKLGFKCPAMYNPADYVLEITSVDFGGPENEVEARKALESIHDTASKVTQKPERQGGQGPGPAIENQTTYWEQFSLLYRRIFRDNLRNKVAIIIKFAQGLFTTLLMAFLYGNMRDGKIVIINQSNITALLFFITVSGLFGPLFSTIQAFAPEISIVLRERMNNLYSIAPYYLAKLLVALPVELVPLWFQNTLAFWVLQFNHSFERYVVFLLFTCSMSLASISVGFMIAVVSGGNIQGASAAVSPIALLLMLLGGFYINSSTIPVWITWFSNIEYLRFAYEGLSINEFNKASLAAKGIDLQADGSCPPNTPTTLCESGAQILSDIYNNGHYEAESYWDRLMWTYLAYIVISVAIFNIIGYFVLLVKGPKYLSMTAA